jgi:hypothetical protein
VRRRVDGAGPSGSDGKELQDNEEDEDEPAPEGDASLRGERELGPSSGDDEGDGGEGDCIHGAEYDERVSALDAIDEALDLNEVRLIEEDRLIEKEKEELLVELGMH